MAKISIVTSFFSETIEMVERLYVNVKKCNVNWEWIVTNDFSNNSDLEDKLTRISNQDVRVRKITQKTKLEIFRNPSLYSEGDFIFVIDGDDVFNPVYLEHALVWFKRFPEVICIISGCRWVSDTGHVLKYHIDSPFETPHEKAGGFSLCPNYTGRIWRNTHQIDWTEIFKIPENIIRMSDHFIVEYLSTKGDILHLPRIYIDYEVKKNSNSRIDRTKEELHIIETTYQEFWDWRRAQKPQFSRFPYFFSGETEFQRELQPFLKISWDITKGVMGVIGFSRIPAKRKMLSQLYPEFTLLFDPSPHDSENIDFYVLCDIDKMEYEIPIKKWFTHFEGEDKKEIIFSFLRKYSNLYWTNTEGNFWVERI